MTWRFDTLIFLLVPFQAEDPAGLPSSPPYARNFRRGKLQFFSQQGLISPWGSGRISPDSDLERMV